MQVLRDNERKQCEAAREMQAFVEKNWTWLEDIWVEELIHQGHRL